MSSEVEKWMAEEVERITAAWRDAAEKDPRLVQGTGAQREAMSKFDGFVFALRLLCKAHGVLLTTSGYDLLEVWDAGAADDGLSPIECGRIVDQTKPNAKLTGPSERKGHTE